MNNSGSKRREWVKTAVIIFLSIMVVLTFFSNTIMNYSLPEVAVQAIQSGSITARIRGTGTIESGDPYNVQINETRTVESVLVKNGDIVEKGDVLFVLADKESEELRSAEEAYETAILDFERAILNGEISNSVINNVQSGSISTLQEYQRRVQAAQSLVERRENEVKAIQKKIDELNTEIKKLEHSNVDTSKEARDLFNAQNNYDRKNEELSRAKSTLSELEISLSQALDFIRDYEAGLFTVSTGDISPEDTDKYYEAKNKERVLPGRINDERNRVNSLQAELYKHEEEVKKRETALNDKKGNSAQISKLTIDLENQDLLLTNKQRDLADAEEDRAQLIADIGQELNLHSQSGKIENLREKIEELRANAVGAVIEAPVAGTITSVNITAGQDTVAGSPVATMQPEGKGFTMSFSVTNEQAQRLTVGSRADLVNYWMYYDVTITLASIRPDPTEPGQKKLLTFDVSGGVLSGQSVSVNVGDRSANYEMLVPNSAIRQDSNGHFILVVETRSGPLGNRHIATRRDVEILASDDTQSAIAGGVYAYEYVITTSTQPVEPGQQVRLADS